MEKSGAGDAPEKAAGLAEGGRDEAAVMEEDVFAKQERLFSAGTEETPPQSVE
ncbi:MAG TPA: hypothetical protein VN521_01640 [Negativicutes bacterium]|nr:hypothetical protein [Negativicutes bacterium]